jgi:Xaa-Pro dipeptidase
MAYAPKMNIHDRLAFTEGEYRRRWSLVQAGMAEKGIDVLLVRTPENICYLTGYETPGYYAYHCLIVPMDQEPVLVVRRLEAMNAAEFSWLVDTSPVEDHEVPWDVTIREVRDRGLGDKCIGVEEASFFSTVAEYKGVIAALKDATVVDGSGIVEEARVVKSDEEIALMRICSDILDQGTQAGIDAVRSGDSEDQIAATVHEVLVRLGSEYPSLPNFVCSGPRASVTHATWQGRTVEKGDVVFFELSAVKHRYNVAILRCVCDGEPGDEVRKFAEASEAALAAAMGTIKPGVTCDAVYWATHNAIVERGLGEYHPHRAGYSIGVSFPPDWGEGQILSLRNQEMRLLEPNMCFHIIPAIQRYREIGVCLSHTIRVTETGCEPFSKIPPKLIVK